MDPNRPTRSVFQSFSDLIRTRLIRDQAELDLETRRAHLEQEFQTRLSVLNAKEAEFAERSERSVAEQAKLNEKIGLLTDRLEEAKGKAERLESEAQTINRKNSSLLELSSQFQDQIKSLEHEKDFLGKQLRAERDALQEANSKIVRLSSQIRELKKQLGSIPGFLLSRSPEVLEWLGSLEAVGSGLSWTHDVATIGNGPFDCAFMDSMVGQAGFQPCYCGDADAGVLIVGSENWTSEELIQHVEAADSVGLRVYSQEMALFALQTGIDPFDAGESILMEMGRNHPALDFLRDSPFEWPNLEGLEGGGVIYVDPSSWRAESPLTSMGYHVGLSSELSQQGRRRILGNIFRGRIQFPSTFPESSRREWGTPGSNRRLRKMVEQLRKNIQLHQNQRNYRVAVREWRSDLEWLGKNSGRE
jgi:hypothetical protein